MKMSSSVRLHTKVPRHTKCASQGTPREVADRGSRDQRARRHQLRGRS